VLKNLDLKSLAQIEKFWVPISLKDVIVVLEWLLLLIIKYWEFVLNPTPNWMLLYESVVDEPHLS
jgi:hypothetical protein